MKTRLYIFCSIDKEMNLLKKARFVVHLDPEKDKILYDVFCNAYLDQAKEIYFDKGNLKLNMTMYYKMPDDTTKKKRMSMARGYILPTIKKNAQITPMICLSHAINQLVNIAYKSKNMLADIKVKTLYSEHPRIVVTISELRGGN